MAVKKADIYYSGFTKLTALQVGNFLGKELNEQEQSFVNSLIPALELHLVKSCNRNFLYDMKNDIYEDILDAGKSKYYLSNYPLKEISLITLDGITQYDKNDATKPYKLNSDFYVYDDYIEFYSTIPSSSLNNRRALKIQYTIDQFWGEDVIFAVKQWAAQIFTQREYGGKNVSSFNFSGYSVSFNSQDVPQFVKDVINSYRKPLI